MYYRELLSTGGNLSFPSSSSDSLELSMGSSAVQCTPPAMLGPARVNTHMYFVIVHCMHIACELTCQLAHELACELTCELVRELACELAYMYTEICTN